MLSEPGISSDDACSSSSRSLRQSEIQRAVAPERIMVLSIIQCNLNHSWNALDLLKQYLIELRTDVCAISEPPPRTNTSAGWYTSLNGSAAIFISVPYPRRLVGRTRSTVTVIIEEMYIISCYVSPNVSRVEYDAFLGELDDAPCTNGKAILCGDFNAKLPLWGCTVGNRRGEALVRWVTSSDLRLANVGNTATCVRWQGSSIVDLTWTSPSLIDHISD